MQIIFVNRLFKVISCFAVIFTFYNLCAILIQEWNAGNSHLFLIINRLCVHISVSFRHSYTLTKASLSVNDIRATERDTDLDGSRPRIGILGVVLIPSHNEPIVGEELGYREENLEGTDHLNAKDVLRHVT